MGDSLTGLPRAVELRVLDRYGGTKARRVGIAAIVKALSVLLRRHPRAALDMAAAAALQAGRAGVQEMTGALRRFERAEPQARPATRARPLARREVRRFLKLLRRGQPNLPEM